MTTQAKAKRTTKKAEPEAKKNYGYLQNAEGRVFEATPELLKQQKKNKFGLIRITKAVFDEAQENGGMTDPIEEFEEEGDL